MKKVLALVLVAIMAFGMIVPVTAATAPKPTGLDVNNIAYGYGYGGFEWLYDNVIGWSTYATGKGARDIANMSYSTVTYTDNVIPYDKVEDWINLPYSMFKWTGDYYPSYILVAANSTWTNRLPAGYTIVDGYIYDATNNVYLFNDVNIAAKEIRAGKIGVRTSVAAGSKAIDSVSISTKDGAIKIKYVEEWVSTKDLDFEFTVYLTFDGKRWNDEGLTFVGTLANEITEVYENDDYVDTSRGQVAEAMEFVKAIEVDLGNGVSIHTKFFKGKKYYGTAHRDADDDADIVFTKYPDVDNVVILKTVGLNSTGDIVKLDTDYSDYYVYDADMVYLGQSNEMLPYSTRYYLANRKLDIVDDEVDDGTAPSIDGPNPETGGDDVAASNPNANPGTGR